MHYKAFTICWTKPYLLMCLSKVSVSFIYCCFNYKSSWVIAINCSFQLRSNFSLCVTSLCFLIPEKKTWKHLHTVFHWTKKLLYFKYERQHQQWRVFMVLIICKNENVKFLIFFLTKLMIFLTVLEDKIFFCWVFCFQIFVQI